VSDEHAPERRGRGTDRRGGGDRRSGTDRRLGDRRLGVDRRSDVTSKLARDLPDAFARLKGEPRARVETLVDRFWGAFDHHARVELAQALLAVLDPLRKPNAPVSQDLRDRCQETVQRWLDART
jgi:hypothetical protein